MVSFSPEEFSSFRTAVNSLEFSICSMLFPDKIRRAVVCTPSESVNLTFDEEEWNDLTVAIDEADCMQQVYDIIKLGK